MCTLRTAERSRVVVYQICSEPELGLKQVQCNFVFKPLSKMRCLPRSNVKLVHHAAIDILCREIP